MLFYRAALPLSSRTLTFVAGSSAGTGLDRVALAEAELRAQALLVLVYLRKGETFAEIAAGFGVGTSTAWRYVNETVALLAARAPEAPQGGPGREEGRVRLRRHRRDADPDRPGRRGPARSTPASTSKHGMNLQVIASPDGDILWVSGALPGSVHDKKAEWIWGVLDELEAAGLVTLADKGYQGARTRRSRTRGRTSPNPKTGQQAHAKLRSPGERANAQLKTWRILRKLRCCPWRAGQLAKAIHVLQIHEANQDEKGSVTMHSLSGINGDTLRV